MVHHAFSESACFIEGHYSENAADTDLFRVYTSHALSAETVDNEA